MQQLAKILAETGIKVYEHTVAVVGLLEEPLPAVMQKLGNAEGLVGLFLDDVETTLIITEKDWERVMNKFGSYRVQHGFRLITLDIALDWSVVGFLAAISGELAGKGIPVGAISAYSRDHLLVKQEYLERALETLKVFRRTYRARV
ncbi:MAG: ACT domain-containing protein [Bacillota bacterium]